MFLDDFLPQGETVNAARYCKTLKTLRHQAVKNKIRRMPTSEVRSLRDNVRPYAVRLTVKHPDRLWLGRVDPSAAQSGLGAF